MILKYSLLLPMILLLIKNSSSLYIFPNVLIVSKNLVSSSGINLHLVLFNKLYLFKFSFSIFILLILFSIFIQSIIDKLSSLLSFQFFF